MVATDIKTKIPEGWQRTFLSESENFRIVGSRVNYWKGLKPYLSTKSVQGTVIAEIEDYVSFNNRPSRANMQPEVGVTAFAKMGNTFKVLYNDEEVAKNYILSTGFCLVKPKIDPKYFFHFIASDKFQNNKELYCEGSTQKAISQKDYDKLEILFPENPKEQQKIAEVLTTIDEAIEKTDAIIEKNMRIKQGLMQDLFRYGIDEHGNIRSEKTHKFKTVRIGNEEMRIPEEWEMGNITDYLYIMTDYVANGSFSSLNENVNVYDTENYAYYVRLYDLRLGLGHKNQTYVDKSSYLFLRKSFVEYEDILIANIGAYAGMVWSVPKLDKKATIAPNMLILKTNDKSEKKYLYYYLKSQIGDKEINNVIGGSGQPKISKTELKTIEIIKISKSEQRRIINVLKSSDKIIKKEQIYKQKLLSLKRGLMEDLLTGKVRVNSLIN